jgi:DNA-binding transcriptional MerR regulator
MEQMSLKDIAALLNVKAYRIEYLLAHGLVAEPQLRISGRRVFSASDLDALRKHFSSKTPATATEPKEETAGV